MIDWKDIVVRLLAALAFSGAIGLQRALTGKAAGMRTHILVGVGAAMFALVSAYGFPSAAANADRIASNVVTGIGFIGGGAILKERGSIKGLTTAAGLWAAAALGLAAGAGLYILGLAGTAVIIVTLVWLRYLELRFPRRMLETWDVSMGLNDQVTVAQLRSVLMPYCRTVAVASLRRDGSTNLAFQVEMLRQSDLEAITAQLFAAGARRVDWSAMGNADVGDGG